VFLPGKPLSVALRLLRPRRFRVHRAEGGRRNLLQERYRRAAR